MMRFGDGEPLLRIRNGSFAYPGCQDRPVIEDLSLEIAAGACVQITGRNGSGKSTLLKLVAGDLSLTKGLREELVADLRPIYFHQDLLKFVGRALTVGEQLQVACEVRNGREGRGRKPSLTEHLAFAKDMLREFDLGLDQRFGDFMEALSGGQRQIVAFVAMLLSGARLLLLDEFTSALDQRSMQCCGDILQCELAKGHIALLAVNHQLDALGLGSDQLPIGQQLS